MLKEVLQRGKSYNPKTYIYTGSVRKGINEGKIFFLIFDCEHVYS